MWKDRLSYTLEERLMAKVDAALEERLMAKVDAALLVMTKIAEQRVEKEYVDRLERMAMDFRRREEEFRESCRVFCENWRLNCEETCLRIKTECDERIARSAAQTLDKSDISDLVLD